MQIYDIFFNGNALPMDSVDSASLTSSTCGTAIPFF